MQYRYSMDQSQPENSTNLPTMSELKRTRVEQQQHDDDDGQQQHCLQLDEQIDIILDPISGTNRRINNSRQPRLSRPGSQQEDTTCDELETTNRYVPHRRPYNKRYNTRHQITVSLMATAILMCCYPAMITFANASQNSLQYTAAFVSSSPINISRHKQNHPFMSKTQQQKTSELDTTWSNAVRQNKSELNESRFGVRKRVQNVLDKAKKRTGVENPSSGSIETISSVSMVPKSKRKVPTVNGDSSEFIKSGLNVIAEAASLGGFESDDVTLDYISKGGNNKYNNDTTSTNNRIESSRDSYNGDSSTILNELVGNNGVKVTKAQMKFYDVRQPEPTEQVTIPSASPKSDVPSLSPSSAFQRPEDNFILREKNNGDLVNKKTYIEKDAFTGDVSAAFSLPREPLPFKLPTLDAEQARRVKNGERVQFQDDMGRAGSGFVVWDVKAPESVVWDCLLDFQEYPQTIPTCREVVMYTNTHLKDDYRAEKPVDFEDGTAAICKHGVPSVTRAQFSLSKFRLKIAAVHKYRPHPKGDYMIFTLDPASTNMVLKYAKGIWYTQSNPDGKEGHTRVWLLCELRVSRILPQWIVDYAAARAMPRATTWLKPQTEAAAQLWLKDRGALK